MLSEIFNSETLAEVRPGEFPSLPRFIFCSISQGCILEKTAGAEMLCKCKLVSSGKYAQGTK